MAKRRIHSKGDYQQEEALAGGTITPGMLIEMNSSAAVIAHNSEGAVAERAFAAEDALQGGIVDDDYSSGDLVTYILPTKGACVNALLESGYSYDEGDILISSGTGTLIQASQVSSGTTIYDNIAVCTEACDLSASGAVDTLSEVRIL
jgi:hypothetical protein